MPKPTPARIDVDNVDEVILLALAALFTAVAIARGAVHPLNEVAKGCVTCADELIDAVVAKRKP